MRWWWGEIFPRRTKELTTTPDQSRHGDIWAQGVGSTAHLRRQLELLSGIRMVHVPYRGDPRAERQLPATSICS
jgi:hypothetical protein